jgi:hypothetical protein
MRFVTLCAVFFAASSIVMTKKNRSNNLSAMSRIDAANQTVVLHSHSHKDG